MYRHLLGLLCGLDSFVTSRIPVFSKRIDFFKVGIDNELLDPLFSFEEVSEEAEPLGQHNEEESPASSRSQKPDLNPGAEKEAMMWCLTLVLGLKLLHFSWFF